MFSRDWKSEKKQKYFSLLATKQPKTWDMTYTQHVLKLRVSNESISWFYTYLYQSSCSIYTALSHTNSHLKVVIHMVILVRTNSQMILYEQQLAMEGRKHKQAFCPGIQRRPLTLCILKWFGFGKTSQSEELKDQQQEYQTAKFPFLRKEAIFRAVVRLHCCSH